MGCFRVGRARIARHQLEDRVRPLECLHDDVEVAVRSFDHFDAFERFGRQL
jgi:hypothetical protein